MRGSNEMQTIRVGPRHGHSTEQSKNRIVTINQENIGSARLSNKESQNYIDH